MTVPYSNYVEEMAATAWGDHLTLDSIANVYNVRIWCIESASQYECAMVAPQRELPTTGDICLGHLAEKHYISVVPTQVYIRYGLITQKLDQS